MRRMEVRCCCDPLKLLGTLPVPEKARTSWTFPVMQRFGEGRVAPTVTLQIATWSDTTHGRAVVGGVAIKADGIPMETLRRIPGFIEHGLAIPEILIQKKEAS